MVLTSDFITQLETKVFEQLRAHRVAYLMGAGASYLGGEGYPLAFELWDQIRLNIDDLDHRAAIQAKLDGGADGIENALDLLDDGGASDTPYRHAVTRAVVETFRLKSPPLDSHIRFVQRLSGKSVSGVRIFSLNYDPLIELAASQARVRIVDGFLGAETCYFEPATFDERIGLLRGSFKAKVFDETVKPLQLFKLHGSLGWYECPQNGVRRGAFNSVLPNGTKRLMIPPQRRKASDTMYRPYSALWSAFRGSLVQGASPANRLVCIGYGFGDEHVNSLIDAALARTDFTLLIFAKALTESSWSRWSVKSNVIVVTESRCSLYGVAGIGHANLWGFERLAGEV